MFSKKNPETAAEDNILKRSGKKFSRRTFLRKAIITEAATLAVVDTGIDRTIGNIVLRAAHRWVLGRRVTLSPEDVEDTTISPDRPAIEVGLGNSNAAGTGTVPVKPLSNRIAQYSTERGIPLKHVSGAVPGSLAENLPEQYAAVKGSIPSDVEQHLDVWPTENQPNKFPDALSNLRSLAKNPRQPNRWLRYFFKDRARIADSLGVDLARSLETVLKDGKGSIKSVKLRGASPVYRADTLQQVGPNSTTTITVGGNSPEQLLAQMVIADWTYTATTTARDVAHAIRRSQQGKVQITVSDPSSEIHEGDYTDNEHFGNATANRIASETAKKIIKRKIS